MLSLIAIIVPKDCSCNKVLFRRGKLTIFLFRVVTCCVLRIPHIIVMTILQCHGSGNGGSCTLIPAFSGMRSRCNSKGVIYFVAHVVVGGGVVIDILSTQQLIARWKQIFVSLDLEDTHRA